MNRNRNVNVIIKLKGGKNKRTLRKIEKETKKGKEEER